ncbi:hypothetical protein [Lysinibacillus sp. LZ02]|uniref:hypothetical protein n=1 Tax=Lysinibacillus sp. LZ02 TaxID=3420668 RepID=UPI003D35BEAB
MKKRLTTYIAAGALAMGVTVSAVMPAIQANDYFVHGHEMHKLDAETREKVDDILINLKKELVTLGVTFPDPEETHDKFEGLDEETKAKVKEIKQQMKDGRLTKEQAAEKCKELGVELPNHKDKMFEELDAAKRKQAEALVAEATTELEKLGVKFHFSMLIHADD